MGTGVLRTSRPPVQTELPLDVASERRALRREIVILAVYFLFFIAATDIVNVRVGIELATLMVLVAAIAITRATRAFLRDWWFLLLGLLLWNLSGPIAAFSPFPQHLDLFLQADRLLFFGRDPVAVIQHNLATPGTINLLNALTALSYNLHVPEPYIAGYFLWRLNRAIYLQFAASCLILLVLGFLTFVFLPAIPPWMASTWYHRLNGVYNGFGLMIKAHPLPFHGSPIFYVWRLKGDAVAAFPSEHAAFPVLEYLAFSRLSRRWSLLLLLWVFWIFFTVLYLGMHWAIDALAGWLYAVVIFWSVRYLAER